MELTKTKLHNILKRYRVELERHNREWEEICRKKCKNEFDGDMVTITTPSIYDYERHNSKGAYLFRQIMAEFENYEVFPKKHKPSHKNK